MTSIRHYSVLLVSAIIWSFNLMRCEMTFGISLYILSYPFLVSFRPYTFICLSCNNDLRYINRKTASGRNSICIVLSDDACKKESCSFFLSSGAQFGSSVIQEVTFVKCSNSLMRRFYLCCNFLQQLCLSIELCFVKNLQRNSVNSWQQKLVFT